MQITQVVVFSKEELNAITNGEVFAFVNPGEKREILIMSSDKYETWCESDSGFLD